MIYLVNTRYIKREIMIAKKDDPRFLVSMPKIMKDELTAVARRNGRTRNSEVLMRLKHSLESDRKNKKAPSVVNG